MDVRLKLGVYHCFSYGDEGIPDGVNWPDGGSVLAAQSH